MKLLNLDDIALDSERTVKYRGISYKVRDFNVSEFIQFQKHFADFTRYYNSNVQDDAPKVVQSAKELVKIGVPDFNTDMVDELNPIQMLAIVSMIANLLPEPEAETETTDTKVESEGKSPAAE